MPDDWVTALQATAVGVGGGLLWLAFRRWEAWRRGHHFCARWETMLGLPHSWGTPLDERKRRIATGLTLMPLAGTPEGIARHVLCALPELQSVGIQRTPAGTVNVWLWGLRLRPVQARVMEAAVDSLAEVMPDPVIWNVRDANTPERRGIVPKGTEWFHAPR